MARKGRGVPQASDAAAPIVGGHSERMRHGHDRSDMGGRGGPGGGRELGTAGKSERRPIERSGGAAVGLWMPGDGTCLTSLPDLNTAPKDRTRGACGRGPAGEHDRRVV
ncbi:hypothetical protein NDU88_000817 [Pleurodeles waltl]|uniref:Uncharacterized protein n=1 Tax=Pleurodeles waltl TaxID=8319 RepID=A0AAV7MQY4_PLEWA|nr:hypothetical protein NDU88_000817 [Pleurodeles waltl]